MRNRIGLGASGAILGTFAGMLLTAYYFYGFGGIVDLWWQALFVAFIFSGMGAAIIAIKEQPDWFLPNYLLYGIAGTGSGVFLGGGCVVATYPPADFGQATTNVVIISMLTGALCGLGYRLLAGRAESE
jgi:hypothetical protein